MKIIANILTNRKFDNCDFFNVVSNKNDLISELPTLVIGWEFAKSLYKNINIISWEIDKNIYWTFDNREKREKYEDNIKLFINIAINNFIKNINYKFISLIQNDDAYESALDFLLDNYGNIVIFINNDMIYLTTDNKFENNNLKWVYGFSLREYEYLGTSKKDILRKLYKSNCKIIDNKDNISMDIKNVIKHNNYIIPCLF